jgi:hypothetical protein
MKYADTVVRTTRLTVRNPFAVVLVSLAVSVSTLPFLTGAVLAGSLGGLAGLWTTSFLLGFVSVGGARIFAVVVEREVSLGTSYFWEGVRSGTRMGLAVGAGTFIVVLATILLGLNPLDGVAGMSVALVGVYALVAWFVLAMFSLTAWASMEGQLGIRDAFTEGGRLVLEEPVSAVWLVVQAVGWTLLSIPLIIAPMLLLPGFVQLLGTAIIARAASEGEVGEGPGPDP